MNEPHAIQLRDGTLVLLCRADKDGYLWRTESGDGALLGPAVAHGDPQPGLQGLAGPPHGRAHRPRP